MKRFLVPLALAVGLLVCSLGSGCGVTGPVPPPGTPGIANCSDTALHAAELKLLPSLESAVALANFADAESAIATIVAQEAITVGGPLALAEASCVIAWIESKAEAATTATADSIESTKVSNAKRWLAKDGDQVANVPQ